ncbi:MAG: winged helix-turn-helix transcriptional regulator [Erysipelotrichaceae bacterium]|nr:winged helix-turn-helix transcriptional regulator [Erysipelotrichaceae bacterium]
MTIPVENGSEVTNLSVEESEVDLSELECRILNLVQTNSEVTFVWIAEELRVSRKHIAACMKTLKEKGMIVRRGNNRKGYWEVKRKR